MELHTECAGWSGARGPLEDKTCVFCAGKKLSEKSWRRCKKQNKKKMVFDLEAVVAICGYHQRQLESGRKVVQWSKDLLDYFRG